MPPQRAEIHVLARAALGILEVEAGAEGAGAARQNHDGRCGIILEAARGRSELAQRLRRERVDAVAAVEPHHRNPPLRSEALLDRHEVRHQCLLIRFAARLAYIRPHEYGTRLRPSAYSTGRDHCAYLCAMSHDHDHHHDHSELSETELRVRALETILTEKGYVEPAALDAIIQAYETRIGPHNGARVVAKAWTDPAFKKALLEDGSKAIGTLGHVSRVGDHLVVVENTPERHNMVVCTLCSCYPWEMLGLPPVWYKAAPYRSRAVKDPRGVLADFDVTLPKEMEIRVWDSTAETRFLVLPMRPAGTEGWNEEQLAELVTRDSMIGTGFPKTPGAPS
ncbi:nitrile hydratase alpha subunit [Bradyrhizobium japonicum]